GLARPVTLHRHTDGGGDVGCGEFPADTAGFAGGLTSLWPAPPAPMLVATKSPKVRLVSHKWARGAEQVRMSEETCADAVYCPISWISVSGAARCAPTKNPAPRSTGAGPRCTAVSNKLCPESKTPHGREVFWLG